MSTANPGYALDQLLRAFEAASSHADAAARVERWLRVVEGMRAGTLAIGSRTPTSAPAWATLEVVHGGFATGALAAASPLRPDELALAADRRALAHYFLGDAGRAALGAMLASGCFRIEVPEEGALLAVVALLARGAVDRAADVLEAIAPYFDQLRFSPQAAARPVAPVSTVHAATIGDMRAALAKIETPLAVRRMNEALAVWAPLTDRAVALVQETVRDGEPARHIPDDWRERAATLLADHAAARLAHRLCKKPHDPKQNLAILVAAMTKLCADPAALSARERGLVRLALDGHARKHGIPGSEQHAAHRAAQARVAGLMTRGESAAVLAARLESRPADGALASVAEVASLGAPIAEGRPLLPQVVAKLVRCLDASVEELVERGILTSGEAIARVLPQISAHVRALGFADPALARLYAAIDAAFRRRRSLLLVGYEHQVRIEELPWVAALEPFRSDTGTSRDGARRLFTSVTALALDSFPYAILPNPLLTELRALAKPAGIDVPVVEELAADIFQGGFTAKFVVAADIAARRLEGTLYAHYYALPITEVRAIARSIAGSLAPAVSLGERVRKAVSDVLFGAPAHAKGGPVAAFSALCARMAARDPRRAGSVVDSGSIIEQQQILTTQNLVPLIEAAQLSADRFPPLALRSFEWLIRRLQRQTMDLRRNIRSAAYAWRQAIAYLSLSPPGAIDAFLAAAHELLRAEPAAFRARFAPILAGLESAHAGQPPAVRFLGWTSGDHPLLAV